MSNDAVDRLWTPNGVSQNGTSAVVLPELGTDIPQAHQYTFTFRYKGKERRILIVAHPGVSPAEVEDRAGEAFEGWVSDLDQEEHKRPPTEEEKKQIGKAMNDFLLNAQKRRESSNGRIFYQGLN